MVKAKSKAVKRARIPAALAREEHALVVELAKSWVREGKSGDHPGISQYAHDVLVRHGIKVET